MTRPAKRPGPGRPPLGDDVVQVVVRAPTETRDRWAAAAEARGVTLAEWARGVLDRASRR